MAGEIPTKEEAKVQLYGVDRKLLTSRRRLPRIFKELVANDLGLTIMRGPITEPFHPIGQAGITCVIIIGESLASLHTYPEDDFANIDIQTCAESKLDGLDLYLLKRFSPQRMVSTLLNFINGSPDKDKESSYHICGPNSYQLSEILFASHPALRPTNIALRRSGVVNLEEDPFIRYF